MGSVDQAHYINAIPVSLCEKLLAALDFWEEVKKQGRSAILRGTFRHYLRHRSRAAISDQCRRGYVGDGGLGEEFRD